VVRCLSENANSGIFVSESLSSGQYIPVRRDTVVAFLGPALRGPVGIPVTIGSVDEYLKRFGIPGCDSPLLETIRQFFLSGGENAIVVRVCNSIRYHCINLPGPSGMLTLEAINPGPHELLRASIDYDGIPLTDFDRFNLVVHRLASNDRPIVEQQEVYRGLSVDISDENYIGHALHDSKLIGIKGVIPEKRPDVTFHRGIEVGVSYIYVGPEWLEPEGLTDYDLIGCNTEGTGLLALDQVPSIDLVCLVPDTGDLGPVALFTAERYCRQRNAILLVDPPTHWSNVADAIQSARESGFASPNVATYFPRPTDQEKPLASVLGAFAGALASSDARVGIWNLQENTPLQMRAQICLPVDLNREEQQALKRVGINALQLTGPSRAEMVGLVTLNRGSGCKTEWDELCLRRTVLFILETIARGTRWAAFQTNGVETRDELVEQVRQYLNDLFTAGALNGTKSADAGYVICDLETGNSRALQPADDKAGISFVIGFTPRGQALQSFRFHQRPVECRIQTLHIEHPVALAS